ncbi:unnamed protein product, partial [Ceratitis capitata]
MALKLEDNQYTKNEKERAMIILRNHFPDTTSEITISNGKNQNPDKVIWLLAKKIINYSSVEWTTKLFEKFKTPGID